MAKRKPISSPLKLIEDRPSRRSRSETLVRRLLSTSYPHAIFANVALSLLKAGGEDNREVLYDTAKDLRDDERGFGLFDFLRYLEIRRDGREIHVAVKRMIVDENTNVIRDSRRNHEEFRLFTIELEAGDYVLDDLDELAGYLVEQFYRVATPWPDQASDLKRTQWRVSRKEMTAPPNGQTLAEVEFTTKEEQQPFHEVVDFIQQCMAKPYFHVSLAVNAINCHGEGVRIQPVQ